MNVANARWFGSRLYFSKTSRQPRRLGFWLRLYLILEFWHQIVDDSVAFFNTHRIVKQSKGGALLGIAMLYLFLLLHSAILQSSNFWKLLFCWTVQNQVMLILCAIKWFVFSLQSVNDFISVIWVRRNSHIVCIDASGSYCVWFRAIAWGLVIEETLGFKKCALYTVLYTVFVRPLVGSPGA